ncbi:hypothetical protein KCU78_g8057, partial [Aureobasidium melanogenum]
MENAGPAADSRQMEANPIPVGSRSFRKSVDDSVHQQDPEMWKRARLFVRNITSRYVNYADQSITVFERDLHNLWYLFIGAAKVTPTDAATADRLAIQILVAREMGILKRISSQHADGQVAYTSGQANGPLPRIWVDLPFLTADLRAAWTEAMTRSGALSSDHLANLAGFTARLVAFGIYEAELSQCGLLLLREALEIPRQLLENNDTDQNDDKPLSYFMPALLAWLQHGSYKLFGLAARGHASKIELEDRGDDEDRWVAAGPLLAALSSENGGRITGFSMVRWDFWKQELDDIAGQSHSLEDNVQGQARRCFNYLNSWEGITGGDSHDRDLARKVYFDTE